MPYIDPDFRDYLDDDIDTIVRMLRNRGGDGAVNYVISRIVSEVYAPPRLLHGEWPYTSITRVVAALECAKLEFYRRVAAPKEDAAILKNGDLDVYRSG